MPKSCRGEKRESGERNRGEGIESLPKSEERKGEREERSREEEIEGLPVAVHRSIGMTAFVWRH